jgi:hypothetical protein
MDFHCHLAQVEFVCNLFVLATGYNERQDLSFAQRLGHEALLQLGNDFGLLAPELDRAARSWT